MSASSAGHSPARSCTITRRMALLGLVACGVGFITAQMFLFGKLDWVGFARITNLWGGGTHLHSRIISPYRATKLFADAAAKYKIPVFLIEPGCLNNISLLRTVDTNKVKTLKCKYLCRERNVTTFGLLDPVIISNDFIEFLVKIVDIKWKIFYGQDPRVLTLDRQQQREIPLHYIFEYSGHFIHLVIFYERHGNFLWHGVIREDVGKSPRGPSNQLSCIKMLNLRKLKFGGRYAGAYEKMEFANIVADGLKLRIPKHIDAFLAQVPFSRFLECNYEEARVFKRRYSQDESPEAQEFYRLAKDVLEKGKGVMDEFGVRFWLSSGTCLGWFRECDIITHSKDVDFGVWIKDYKNGMVDTFGSHGFDLKHQFGKVSDSLELSFVHEGVKLDIFFFYEEVDHMWNGGTEARSGNKFKYDFPKFSLCWAELLGIKVRVPCNTRQYIEANYGSDWGKRIISWDWKSSPPNVRPNGQWERDEWPQVIQVY